jgi:hypothetical protein
MIHLALHILAGMLNFSPDVLPIALLACACLGLGLGTSGKAMCVALQDSRGKVAKTSVESIPNMVIAAFMLFACAAGLFGVELLLTIQRTGDESYHIGAVALGWATVAFNIGAAVAIAIAAIVKRATPAPID